MPENLQAVRSTHTGGYSRARSSRIRKFPRRGLSFQRHNSEGLLTLGIEVTSVAKIMTLGFFFLVILLWHPVWAEDCSGHGSLTADGKCNCTKPKPDTDAPGFVGDQCETAVYYAVVSSGSEVVEFMCGGQPCPALEPEHSVCFYWPSINRLPDLGLQLSAKDGDAQLKGLLLTAEDKMYPSSQATNSFVVSASAGTASYMLDKKARGDYTDMYVCVSNTGSKPATAIVRAAADACPFTLNHDGNKTVCSSHGTCQGAPPVCVCSDKYARPQAPVLAGLGFEECSATSMQIDAAKQHVDMQMPGRWGFFNFTIDASAQRDRYVSVVLTATDSTSSDVELYLKYWQAPGRAASQYDVRADPGDFIRRRDVRADLSSSVSLNSSDPAYKPGVWFIGVYVNGDECVSFDLQLAKYSCPNNCGGSSRGSCDEATGTCTCTSPEFVGADCSSTLSKLALADLSQPHTVPPRSGFTYDRMEVAVGDVLSKSPGHGLSLIVKASFTSSAPLPKWVTERPVLLTSGFPDDYYNATLRSVLQDADTSYALTVDAGQVPSDTLYVSIFNPISGPYEIGYTITVVTSATCLNGCSGHGTCSDAAGTCACEGEWAGPDCSVDMKKPAAVCEEGTLKEEPVSKATNGKTYAVCVCSGENQCSYTDSSEAMTRAFVICSPGYTVSGADPNAIKLSDGRTVPGGGSCKKLKIGTSGGMVFFFCLLSIVLFCGLVVGSKFGLERYQIWRASQVGGYSELGASSDGKSLWDAFTGARSNANQDSW